MNPISFRERLNLITMQVDQKLPFGPLSHAVVVESRVLFYIWEEWMQQHSQQTAKATTTVGDIAVPPPVLHHSCW